MTGGRLKTATASLNKHRRPQTRHMEGGEKTWQPNSTPEYRASSQTITGEADKEDEDEEP